MIRASLIVAMALAANLRAQRDTSPAADAARRYPPSAHLRVTRNLEYARYGNRRLLLDLYLPARIDTVPMPVIVVVRGGGWHVGDKDGFAFIAGNLAENGFASVCIEYRPSEQARFPAAVNDVKAAVRWVRANAVRFSFDSKRIGAIGGSAGGHLVALLAASADEPTLEGLGGNPTFSSRVAAVVAMAPLTDFRLTWSQPVRQDIEAFLGPGVTATDQRLLAASPVTHVTASAAPMLLIHSRADSAVSYQQSLALKARYEAWGRPIELITLEDAPHAFWNFSRWFPQTMRHSIDFLRRELR